MNVVLMLFLIPCCHILEVGREEKRIIFPNKLIVTRFKICFVNPAGVYMFNFNNGGKIFKVDVSRGVPLPTRLKFF